MADTRNSPDVLVIGAGAVGASVAYELARLGASTVLVESGPHVAAGCSAGNAGLVCPSHSAPLATPKAVRDGIRWMFSPTSPFYLRPRPAVLPWLGRFLVSARPRQAARSTRVLLDLTTASLRMHREYVADGVPTGYETRGILDVFEQPETFEAAQARLRAASDQLAGLTAEPMSGDRARELVPTLSPHIAGGIFFAEEGHCDGREFVEAVAGAASKMGAEIRLGQGVRELQAVNGRVSRVVAGSETLTPGTVVLAAGAWSRALAKQVGLSIPLEAGKGYHIDLETVPTDPQMPVFMTEARVIATPLNGRLRLSGTLELAGLDLSINSRRAEAVREAVERILGNVRGRPAIETWSGLRPCAPDGLPIVGTSDRVANLVVATGHAMMGLAMAPVTGQLVSQLVAGQPTSIDTAPLSPDRFRMVGGRRARRTAR